MRPGDLADLIAWGYVIVGLAASWWMRPARRPGLIALIAWPWAIAARVAQLFKAGTYPTWGPPE